jgi:hypothetical protein
LEPSGLNKKRQAGKNYGLVSVTSLLPVCLF